MKRLAPWWVAIVAVGVIRLPSVCRAEPSSSGGFDDPAMIQAEADSLTAAGDQARQNRVHFVQQLTARCLGDRALCKSIRPATWALCAVWLKDLPKEVREDLSRCLIQGVAGDPQTLRGLGRDILVLEPALARICGQEVAGRTCGIWIQGCDDWRDWPLSDLISIAANLGKAGAVGQRARVRLIGHVESRYLVDDAAIRTVKPDQWWSLVKLLVWAMPVRTRHLWSGRIYGAYSRDPGLDALSDEEYEILRSALRGLVEKRFEGEMPRRAHPLDKLKSEDGSANLAENTAVLRKTIQILSSKDRSPVTLAERLKALKYLQEKYLVDNAATRSIPLNAWYHAAGTIRGQLSPEECEFWGRRLWEAFVADPSALAAVQAGDCQNLVRGIWRISGDAAASEALDRWMEATQCWSSLNGEQFLVVMRGVIFDREEGAIRVPVEKLRAHRKEFTQILLQHYTADWDILGTLDAATIADVCRTLEVLGDAETGALLQTQWRLAGAHSVSQLDAATVEQLGAGNIRLLCRKAACTPSDEQAVVAWDAGLQGIALLHERTAVPLKMTEASWSELEAMVSAARIEGLSRGRVLKDLNRLPLDRQSRQELADRMVQSSLIEAVKSRQQPVPEIEQGLRLEQDGKLAEALAEYQKTLDRLAGDDPARPLMEVIVAKIALVSDQTTAPTVPLLPTTVDPDGLVYQRAWGLSLQALARRTRLAVPEARRRTWVEGLSQLADQCPQAVILFPQTLEELDRLTKTLDSEKGALSATDVLCDLLVLAPEPASLQALESRQVDHLVSEKEWAAAVDAARLAVLLSVSSVEGPMPAVRRCQEVMSLAGASREDCLELEACALSGALPTGPGAGSAPSSQATRAPVDRGLALCAEKLLQESTGVMTPRRRAYLAAFAGRADEATRALAEAVRTSPGVATGDVPVILTLVGRGPGAYSDFLRTLNHGGESPQAPDWAELADACRALASQGGTKACVKLQVDWQGRLTRWAIQALAKGGYAWAEGMCLLCRRCGGDEQKADAPFDALIRQSPSSARGVVEEQLRPLLPGLPPEMCRALLLRAARLMFDQGDFVGCTEMLGELRRRGLEAAGPKDSRMEVMRAISLIRLRRMDEALAELEQAKDMVGDEELQAQALLLLGYLYLDDGRHPEALDAFREITQRFPRAPACWKACEMVLKLDGASSANSQVAPVKREVGIDE